MTTYKYPTTLSQDEERIVKKAHSKMMLEAKKKKHEHRNS